MWDDAPVDVSTEVNFIWSIANKLRGTYQSDKYKDVIIPMVIIRRFECALEATKQAVVEQYKKNPAYPAKAMYRVSGYQFFNTSEYTLAELVNDPDHLAANFRNYIEGFSANVQDIIKSLDFDKQIDKMDKNNRLLSVVKAFSELDLDPKTIDNVKMGYIFEDLIRRFSENAEAGDHYTGRDIIKLMVNILLLLSHINIKHPGPGFNLDGKIRATQFVQKKQDEHTKSDIVAKPVVKLPSAETFGLTPPFCSGS